MFEVWNNSTTSECTQTDIEGESLLFLRGAFRLASEYFNLQTFKWNIGVAIDVQSPFLNSSSRH